MEASQRNGKLCQQTFRRIYPLGDLKEAILTQIPAPENMDTVKKIDNFRNDLFCKKEN